MLTATRMISSGDRPTRAAAAEILAAQARMVAELADRGVLVVQTTPGALSAVVINQYLDVKARHLL